MQRFLRLFVVFPGVLLFVGCAAGACTLPWFADDSILIMTYNLHNLFDEIADGSEYPEFCPATSGWDRSAYMARINDFGRVIRGTRGTHGRGPDIVVLTEVENQRVVEQLRDHALGARRYPVALATSVPGNAIQIGVLSRFPAKDVLVHGVYPEGGRRVRPILEVVLVLPDGGHLHLFAAHWPSKIGGEDETEPLRLQSAAVVARRVRELSTNKPKALVLLAGDLNQTLPEDIDRCWLRGADEPLRAPRSLMAACEPDMQQLDELQRPLFVTHSLPLAASNKKIWYSPWGLETHPGSFVFRDNWERIDHFLLGPGLGGERYYPVDFWVEVRDWMLTPSGYPRGYRPSQRTGLSDHLPVVLKLRQASAGQTP